MENRNGLVVDARLSIYRRTAELESVIDMLGELPEGRRIMVGQDKGYDCGPCVQALRQMKATARLYRHVWIAEGD
jgi:hypothetical protein